MSSLYHFPARRRVSPRRTFREQLDEALYLAVVTGVTTAWLVFLGDQVAAFLRHL